MKKFLLSLSIAAMTAATASAFVPDRANMLPEKQQAPQAAMLKDASRAHEITDDGFVLQFSDEIYNWTLFLQQNKLTYRMYIPVPAEMTSEIAGNQITAIRFSMASTYSTSGRTGYVFVTEDPESDEYVTKTSCDVINSYAQYQAGGNDYQEVALEEPYTIKDGVGFYFGVVLENMRYSSVTGKADYPVAYDGMTPNAFAGVVEVYNYASDNAFIGSLEMGTDVGTNLYMAAVTVGDSHGFSNYFTMGSPLLGNFTLPVFTNNEQPTMTVPFQNNGSNKLETIEYKLKVNGEDCGTYNQNISILPGKMGYVELEIPELPTGRNNIEIVVVSVNGKEIMQSTYTSCFILDGEGVDRSFVVEEFTGTWCGYCPAGIVGLEYMSTNYPDSFVGIAVHSGDEFETDSYAPLLNNFADGFPSCVVNRDPIYLAYPSADQLEKIYNEYWLNERGVATMSAKGTVEDDELNVTVNTTFCIDEANADYKIAVVLMENGLLGNQKNSYSGYPNELEWWGDQASTVAWIYSDTARDIFDCFGLNNSVETNIVAGQEMKFDYAASLENIEDPNELLAVALLLDGQTGVVLQAARVTIEDSGVESIFGNSNPNAPVEYYNLQGIRVDSPANGVYIRRQANDVKKLMIR